MKNSIIVILNSSINGVSTFLAKNGIKFKLVSDINKKVKGDNDVVYGFTSVNSLIKNIDVIKKTPILWETASVVHHLSMDYPVTYIDAQRLANGIIYFKELDFNLLLKCVKYDFKKMYDIKIERVEPIQYGNGSEFSKLLNEFIGTIPDFIVEPTLVALVKGVTKSSKVFREFVKNNRLCTDKNNKQYMDLINFFKTHKNILDFVKHGKGKLDSNDKSSLQRIKILIRYYDKNLSSYLDCENNVNLKSEE